MDSIGTAAWNLLTELRKEILEAQKIRAQVIGFKITFVSAGVALVVANQETVPLWLLVVPAFSAVFFDLLIISYGVSIKRIALYTRAYLEPKIREASSWPKLEPLWEEYMSRPESKQPFSLVGNLGITLLVSGVAMLFVIQTLSPMSAAVTSIILTALIIYDTFAYLQPRRIAEKDVQRLYEVANPPRGESSKSVSEG